MRARLQALVDPRMDFSIASGGDVFGVVDEALRERQTRFRGRPDRLVYVPEAYMTPIRPIVEGQAGGSVFAGRVRLSWAVRIFAALLLVYLVFYGVIGIVYGVATGQPVAALSVIALPAAYGEVRFLRFLFDREARRAVRELERLAGQATSSPQR